MKPLALSLALAVPVAAVAECRMVDQTLTRSEVRISQRTAPVRTVTETAPRQCHVRFRILVDGVWHDAHGSQTWQEGQTVQQACGEAALRAERAAVDRIGRSRVTNQSLMVCDDDERFRTVRRAEVGTVARLDQYRPHPEFPRAFIHNGTQCRWFLESGMSGSDVRTWQGIICEVQDGRWAVVDRF
jgi:hypothetical protein